MYIIVTRNEHGESLNDRDEQTLMIIVRRRQR